MEELDFEKHRDLIAKKYNKDDQQRYFYVEPDQERKALTDDWNFALIDGQCIKYTTCDCREVQWPIDKGMKFIGVGFGYHNNKRLV